MGFKLNCPNCGCRSYHEYHFGGELREFHSSRSDQEDYDNTWLRTNVAGLQRERWFHWAGCHRWMTVERDTRDNSVREE